MKQLLIFVSFLIFLRPILPVFEYMMNYDYIVTNLCENKAKPELKCNGKCHLAKQLAKSSEGSSENSSDKKNTFKQTENLFFQEIQLIELHQIYFQHNTKSSNNYSNLYVHLNDCVFFHPPTQISKLFFC